MEKIIYNLFTTESAQTALLFFFGYYFFRDLFAKFKKVDHIEESVSGSLKVITDKLTSVQSSIDVSNSSLKQNTTDISEMKALYRDLSHRLVAVETILKIKELQKDGELVK